LAARHAPALRPNLHSVDRFVAKPLVLRVRPFLRDELAVPSENRVRCDDRRDLRQHPTAQPLAEGGHPSPVVIRQPQTSMAPLRLQDAVLFAQVHDDLVLLALEPGKDATKSCTGITGRSLCHFRGAVFGHYALVRQAPIVRCQHLLLSNTKMGHTRFGMQQESEPWRSVMFSKAHWHSWC
jgi:hypothetical protein